ncbi:MAG: hypothetical protein KUG67_03895 [Proteobacteria bacterium]|nr:hypothetical protein [Pseudomonadota bacterium]
MIWTISYWIFLTLAIATAFYALFWDRPGFRGRPKLRCKKCWYDLTDSPGDLNVEPIQCSECGKKPPSRKSMQKTRRSKKWIMIAVVFAMSSYTAGVWPRVSRYNYSSGVLGAIPTPVLILALPILPNEAGTKVDRTSSPAAAIPYNKRPMSERIAHQLKIRLYEAEDTSRLDHWLFTKFAERQSSAELTEKTAIRGETYSYVYNAWARQQRMTREEEHWARSVYFLELETRSTMPQMAPVHARIVAFRRLLDDRRIRVRVHKKIYELKSVGPPSFGSQLVPVDRQYGERWDGTIRLKDFVRWANHFSPSPIETIAVEGMIYEGDPYADIWWPVAIIRQEQVVDIAKVTYTSNGEIQSVTGCQLVEDLDQAQSWIKKNLVATFKWDHDEFGANIGWPRGVRIGVTAGELKKVEIPGFTFGGSIWLVAKLRDKDDHVYVKKLNPTWWALRDQVDQNGERVFDGDHEWVPFTSDSTTGLGFRYITNDSTIDSMWIEIIPNDSMVGEGQFAAFWDMDMNHLYPKLIRLDLSGFDRRRLQKIADE